MVTQPYFPSPLNYSIPTDLSLLHVEQELSIARAISDKEIETWYLLFSNPSWTRHVCSHMNLVRAFDTIDTTRLQQLALRCLRTQSSSSAKNSLETLKAMARAFAENCRAQDLDRIYIDTIVPKVAAYVTTVADRKQWHCIVQCYRQAKQLRTKFITANLRLVVSVARKYDRGIVPLADLIQEGNLGLMHAVGRFDPKRGLRFSTYACWWIRHSIGRAIADKSRNVRIPVHMQEAKSKIASVEQYLVDALGRKPTREEVAQHAKKSANKLREAHQYLMGQGISLEQPQSTSDRRTLHDTIPSPCAESPVDRLQKKTLENRLQSILPKLSRMEYDVLQRRFGLNNKDESSFREIGRVHKLSRERIRQIQNTALAKLKRGLKQTSAPTEILGL